MKLVCFISIKLFFATEFIYEDRSLVCVIHFLLFYANFESILYTTGHEEKCYHYNSHSLSSEVMQ